MEQERRVLVVDDDPAIRQLVRKYLEWMGLYVIEAHDGQAAITKLGADGPFDLVCLDLMLPQSSGFEVCEYIQKTPLLVNIPIMVISAKTLPVDRAYAEEMGASAYLTKPFSRDVFAKRVRALLDEQNNLHKRAAP